jgi:hypothetical protein
MHISQSEHLQARERTDSVSELGFIDFGPPCPNDVEANDSSKLGEECRLCLGAQMMMAETFQREGHDVLEANKAWNVIIPQFDKSRDGSQDSEVKATDVGDDD